MHKNLLIFLCCIFLVKKNIAQLNWKLVDSLNAHLPKGVKVFYTNDSLDGKPNIAYYVEADLKNEQLIFDVDTTLKRLLTPTQFFEKNNKPLVVVNGTFFSFKTMQNLNTVIKNGMPISFNIKSVKGKGKDSVQQVEIFRSAIGIDKNRNADVAWIHSDSSQYNIYASEKPIIPFVQKYQNSIVKKHIRKKRNWKRKKFDQWNMQTAIGGGPVLLQNGDIQITNEEEMMFTGKAIQDKHPRTAMGYTNDHKLIILVIQGRFPNIADGASLLQEAQILKDLKCVEALNLDGGGSSCLLINGATTITPSDKTGQRAIPAVFLIKSK
jgi:Phosphodiester glycosidase